MKDHILCFKSRNEKRSLKGTICAILHSSLNCDDLKPGPVPESSCFRLVEGLFYEDGIL